MSAPPVIDIDPVSFAADPYPALAAMRAEAPICYVPQLDAVLITRRDDVATLEKMVDVFSSRQPGGLMTVLMGENMMRKDGETHLNERKQAFPAFSPRTVRDRWRRDFEREAQTVIDGLRHRSGFDVVTDFAMPVSGHALRHITGLTNLTAPEMDQVSQAMIDGVGNYHADPAVEARCHDATARIDAAIDERCPESPADDDMSLLAVLARAGQGFDSVRANIKLAISGGQNEPRDAIAGAIAALLERPDQRALVDDGTIDWTQVFEEYARWNAPIGMSPRRIACDFTWNGIDFAQNQRAFLMFGSANRDETHFERSAEFDARRDTAKAVSFGAGPHFCAGAAAARTLIADVALPMFFDAFPDAALTGEVRHHGWAFRGPIAVEIVVRPSA